MGLLTKDPDRFVIFQLNCQFRSPLSRQFMIIAHNVTNQCYLIGDKVSHYSEVLGLYPLVTYNNIQPRA
jgi:hypothetical protein